MRLVKGTFVSYVALAALAGGLSACGKTSLFGDKSLPDESRVIAGPKLAVPPDFELRPPREGDKDFATKLSDQKSEEIQTLIGGDVSDTAPQAEVPTDADSWLVSTIGGAQVSDVHTSTTVTTVGASGMVVTSTVPGIEKSEAKAKAARNPGNGALGN